MTVLDRFCAEMERLKLSPGPALVAVSGGADSVALLDLLANTADRHRLSLTAAHVDHGIHVDSGHVATAVAALAARFGFPFESTRLFLGADATETEARTARHAWLQRTAAGALIFLAHHADDQAETVLMRALAGSGPAGLAAMAPRSGPLVRPLLPFRREELARYVHERGLPVWVDPANSDPSHLRSWLRTVVLPTLERRVTPVVANLIRTAGLAAADRSAWNSALDALPDLDATEERDAISVAAAPIAAYDSALGEAILKAAARRVGCTLGSARARRLIDLARANETGRMAPLGGNWAGELAYGRLRIFRRLAPPAPRMLVGTEGAGEWGGWKLRWSLETAPGRQARRSMSAWFTPAAMAIRPPTPGERIRPLRGNGTRLLVRCFQDARVPRGRREGWPVIELDGGVAWVPGVCRADALVPQEGAEALRVDATYL